MAKSSKSRTGLHFEDRRDFVVLALGFVSRVVDPDGYVHQPALWNRQPVRLFIRAGRFRLEVHVQRTVRVVPDHGGKQSVTVARIFLPRRRANLPSSRPASGNWNLLLSPGVSWPLRQERFAARSSCHPVSWPFEPAASPRLLSHPCRY